MAAHMLAIKPRSLTCLQQHNVHVMRARQTTISDAAEKGVVKALPECTLW